MIATILISFSLSYLFLSLPIQMYIGLLFVLAIGALLILQPKIGLFIILLILSWRGLLGGIKYIPGASSSFDAGGLINIFVSIWIVLYVVIWKRNPFSNNVSKSYCAFLLVSSISCFYPGDCAQSL